MIDHEALSIDERAKRIIQTLRPSDPGSWEANQIYVLAELREVEREVWDSVCAHGISMSPEAFWEWCREQGA